MEHNNATIKPDYFHQPQCILITGSSSGIGFACARALTQEFCRVYLQLNEQQRQFCSLTLILTGRNKNSLQQAQHQLLTLAKSALGVEAEVAAEVGVPYNSQAESAVEVETGVEAKVGVPYSSQAESAAEVETKVEAKVGVPFSSQAESAAEVDTGVETEVGVPFSSQAESAAEVGTEVEAKVEAKVGVPFSSQAESAAEVEAGVEAKVGVPFSSQAESAAEVGAGVETKVGVPFSSGDMVGVQHCFRVEVYQCDHSDTAQVKNLTAHLFATDLPGSGFIPGAVIANVGINPVHQFGPKKIATTSTELLLSAFQTNVANTHELLAPLFKHYKQQGGKVVLVGSQAYQFGVRGQLAYNVSKAALVGYFNTVRSEFTGRNVYCHLINPGVVENPRTANLRNKHPDKLGDIKISSESDVAGAICRALLQNEQHNLQLNV